MLINQLKDCGVKDINILGGHQINKIKNKFKNYKIFFYPDYKVTNNLNTLYFFRKLLNDNCIISFSDIILSKKIVKDLVESKKKITLCVDRSKSREGTMKIDIVNNKLKYLGNDPKIDSGNYIGIMKLQKSSIDGFEKAMKITKKKSKNFYFTEAFNYLIKKKIKVDFMDVNKKFWLEIDTKEDLMLARKKFK